MSGTETEHSDQPARRAVTAEDLFRFQLVSDPQVAPDGRAIAYVQTRLRKKKNDYASAIWLAPLEGGEPRRFTVGDCRDTTPRWSPDGSELAFVSTRSGKPQIWIMPTTGGEARRLTWTNRGVSEFAWSSDGRLIAFTTATDNASDRALAADEQEESKEREEPSLATAAAGEWPEDREDEELPEEKETEKGRRARVFDRLAFKYEGQGFIERRKHLFVIPTSGGEPAQVTDGDFDVALPRWSPAGLTLAYASNKEDDADYRNMEDIFTVTLDAALRPAVTRRVTGHNLALEGYDWLPSGDGFAVFAHERVDEGAWGTNFKLWRVALGGTQECLTEALDLTAGNIVNSDLRAGTGENRPRFSRDGNTVYFMVTDGGTVAIYSVAVDGGQIQRVVGGDRAVLNFDVSRDGIVFAATDPTLPNDLFFAGFDGSERRLTEVNEAILGELTLAEPERFSIARPDGAQVEGWLLGPRGQKPGAKYPLILEIHGGPHTAYGYAYFHEFQLLAAAGNFVMYTNPRGSQGYGQRFLEAITNDWGGVDYEDLMACVDHALQRDDVDPSRLGVAGGSYGGFMTVWIVGHTRRFAAAAASRAVTNVYSSWGSGDRTWALYNWEFSGPPQERTQLYLERSPITYVNEIHTPLLITHAEDDGRVDVEQAEELYIALKWLKRETRLVRFPSGGHDVSRSGKPSLRVERLEHIAGWFHEHLG